MNHLLVGDEVWAIKAVQSDRLLPKQVSLKKNHINNVMSNKF